VVVVSLLLWSCVSVIITFKLVEVS
jgi:hypothetical protein